MSAEAFASLPPAANPAALASAFCAAMDNPDGPEEDRLDEGEAEATPFEVAFEEPPEDPSGMMGPEPEDEGPWPEPEPTGEGENEVAREATPLFESGRKARRAPRSQCSTSNAKAASPVQAPSEAERRFEALRDRIMAKEAAAKRPRLS